MEWEHRYNLDPTSVPGRSGQRTRVFDKVNMLCKRLAVPQQNNCSDCGCFLLTYIEARRAVARA